MEKMRKKVLSLIGLFGIFCVLLISKITTSREIVEIPSSHDHHFPDRGTSIPEQPTITPETQPLVTPVPEPQVPNVEITAPIPESPPIHLPYPRNSRDPYDFSLLFSNAARENQGQHDFPFITFGIPTMLRKGEVLFLGDTVMKIVQGFNTELMKVLLPANHTCKIVILITEIQPEKRKVIKDFISAKFPDELISKVIEIHETPLSLYTPLLRPCALKQNFGDELPRILWRTKIVRTNDLDIFIINSYSEFRYRLFIAFSQFNEV